ncbi:MAG: hypothetical protein JSS20_03075 [Proteobacteria bacterium]|nr:hypothetical protein [Pseudomonadota bacterium]
MRLYDPTSTGAKKSLKRAPALAKLQGAKLGILENGKLNAPEMLSELGKLFQERHGCIVVPLYHKSNASAPAPKETLAKAVQEVDFLITGLGD